MRLASLTYMVGPLRQEVNATYKSGLAEGGYRLIQIKLILCTLKCLDKMRTCQYKRVSKPPFNLD